MTDTQNIPWKRITVEAAAIVASILLAFAIDAWWDELRDRVVERNVLSTIRAEFETNLEILARTGRSHRRALGTHHS